MKVKECWLGGNNERREGRVSSGGSRRQPPGEREKAAARGEREERGERRVACVRACVRESCVCVEFVYDGRKAGIGGDAARRRASKPLLFVCYKSRVFGYILIVINEDYTIYPINTWNSWFSQ